jgi:hypothetical protein
VAVSSSTLPIYFKNAAVTLREHPAGYVVFEYHTGKREFADFQAALTHTGNLLHRRDWNKILGDQRLMSPFTEEESTSAVSTRPCCWLTMYLPGSRPPKCATKPKLPP